MISVLLNDVDRGLIAIIGIQIGMLTFVEHWSSSCK
jgi:hypothetical protein